VDFCATVINTVRDLKQVTVHGKLIDIKYLVGGDMKFLSAITGHAGQSCNFPCPWCLVPKEELWISNANLELGARRKLRTFHEAIQWSHCFEFGDEVKADYRYVMCYILHA
jgi:hypothetical protein